jgi:hypothetical protein
MDNVVYISEHGRIKPQSDLRNDLVDALRFALADAGVTSVDVHELLSRAEWYRENLARDAA